MHIYVSIDFKLLIFSISGYQNQYYYYHPPAVHRIYRPLVNSSFSIAQMPGLIEVRQNYLAIRDLDNRVKHDLS